jgi:hypothetical protein
VIWESHVWKADLLKRAASLRRRGGQRRWPEASLVRVEQDLMLGVYAVRKLREAGKLTDSVVRRQLQFTRFQPNAGIKITRLNWHHIDRHYDLQRGTRCTKGLVYFCDQIIHSYVFMASFSDSGQLDGFLFVSDRDRARGLWHAGLGEVVATFDAVAMDNVSGFRATWDSKLGDYDVSNS